MTLIKEISLNLFLGKYFLLKVSTEIQHVRNYIDDDELFLINGSVVE